MSVTFTKTGSQSPRPLLLAVGLVRPDHARDEPRGHYCGKVPVKSSGVLGAILVHRNTTATSTKGRVIKYFLLYRRRVPSTLPPLKWRSLPASSDVQDSAISGVALGRTEKNYPTETDN